MATVVLLNQYSQLGMQKLDTAIPGPMPVVIMDRACSVYMLLIELKPSQ